MKASGHIHCIPPSSIGTENSQPILKATSSPRNNLATWWISSCATFSRALSKGGASFRRAQPERPPLQPRGTLGGFPNLQELVRPYVREVLPCIAGRPPDLQIFNSRRPPQP